jgi:penicillin-binding protein 1C
VLSDPDARAFAFGRGGSLEFPFPVAAKTGTSQSYFDNWVVGYTQDVTVGVWVGNFDRTPLRGSSGITGAGPIFQAVMLAATERVRGAVPIGDRSSLVSATHDVERREICALSGLIAGTACPTRASEWLPREGSHDNCDWHHTSDDGLVTVWPDEYHDWARQRGIVIAPAPLSETKTGAAGARTTAYPSQRDARLTIIRPLPGAVFMLDPTLRPEFQSLTFAARGGRGSLRWTISGRTLGTNDQGEPERWPLTRGRHDIVVRDASGSTATAWIEVR